MRKLMQEAVNRWIKDDAMTHSAALSFYLLLSLPALLLLSVSIGSIFLKSKSIQDLILTNIQGAVDENIVDVLTTLFEHLPKVNSLSFSTLVSLLILLWTASNFFKQLQKFIDKAWQIKRKKTGAINGYVKNSIVASTAVILFGILLVVSIIADSLVYFVSKLFDNILPSSIALANYSTSIASFVALMIFFVFVYRLLSNRTMSYEYVFIGSLMTVVLITIGKYITTFYLLYSNPLSVYGAIGSVIGLLFLTLYSTIAITFSVEFTKAYTELKKLNNS